MWAGKVSVQFDLQAKYAVELLDEREIGRAERSGREETRPSPRRMRRRRRTERQRDENEKKDPVLKNANEAEVKESCTRPKSQADLIVVLVRLTVTFVCSRLTCPSPLRAPSVQFPRVHPRDHYVLTPHSNSSPHTALLYFGRSLARRPI